MAGTISNIDIQEINVAEFILCDDNGPFLRVYSGDDITDTELDGVTPYAPVGIVGVCPQEVGLENDLELVPFCFIVNAQPGVLHHGYAAVRVEEDTATTQFYYEIDNGAVHLPGAVTPTECVRDDELQVLCDDNGTFLRRYIYGSFGNFIASLDTQLDGQVPYLPVGTIRACTSSTNDTEVSVLCDGSDSFLRRYLYASDGALIGTLDTELDGSTPYAVNGTVRQCYDRLFTVGCTARIRDLQGDSMSNADWGGSPPSFTVTVITNDPANQITIGADSITNLPTGYSATWSVEDTNILGVPTLIDSGPNGRIIVNWVDCPRRRR